MVYPHCPNNQQKLPLPSIQLINFFPLNDVQKPSSFCVTALDCGGGPSLNGTLNRWRHGSCDSGFNLRIKSFMEHLCSCSGLEQGNQHLQQGSRWGFGKGDSPAWGGRGWAQSPLQNCLEVSCRAARSQDGPDRRRKDRAVSGNATTLVWSLAGEGPMGGGGVRGLWGRAQGYGWTCKFAKNCRL